MRVYLTFLFRLGLEILGLEIAFLAFCWLLHQYWNLMQRFSFADVLFIMGTLVGLIGSAGMMRNNPYWLTLSPWGVWANPVQPDEQEKHAQMVDELMHQASFGLRLTAIGVITFLLSIAFTYIK
jgi:hypothetical protein